MSTGAENVEVAVNLFLVWLAVNMVFKVAFFTVEAFGERRRP